MFRLVETSLRAAHNIRRGQQVLFYHTSTRLRTCNMSRQSLTNGQIKECLASINCEESEGEYFSGVESEDEYIPHNIISSESSDEDEMENQAVTSSNPSTPQNFLHPRLR